MPGKRGGGENTKKVAGMAKKAEVAAQKKAAEDQKKAASEANYWEQGAKDTKKKQAAEEKAAEAARKRAEKQALLAEEEKNQPSKPKGAGNKVAQKKATAPSKGTLDLSQLEAPAGPQAALNASGIDNALDALSLATSSGSNLKVDRHPERRMKAAYTAFEERRLEEMKDDKSLRRQQKIEQIRKEFEKSPENPRNQALAGSYDMTQEEQRAVREEINEATESRLTQS